MDKFNEDHLQEYLDGTLDDEARQAVEAHLAGSPAARAQLAELKALFSSLNALPELLLTADLSVGVMAQIEQETAVSHTWPRWVWGLLLGQAILALLLLGNVWASLLDWLGNGRSVAAGWINSVQLPTLTVFEQFWAEVTAVWQTPHWPTLTFDLPTGQWALLFGLALVVWLVGNRLLFTAD